MVRLMEFANVKLPGLAQSRGILQGKPPLFCPRKILEAAALILVYGTNSAKILEPIPFISPEDLEVYQDNRDAAFEVQVGM